VVADTMHARIENHFDVWLETSDLALAWGRCEAKIRAVSQP
jgi:3D (Asp-Asp-Asp) domain-containing protein